MYRRRHHYPFNDNLHYRNRTNFKLLYVLIISKQVNQTGTQLHRMPISTCMHTVYTTDHSHCYNTLTIPLKNTLMYKQFNHFKRSVFLINRLISTQSQFDVLSEMVFTECPISSLRLLPNNGSQWLTSAGLL